MSMQRSGPPQSFNNRGVLPNRKGAKAAALSYILDMFKRKAKAAWSLYASAIVCRAQHDLGPSKVFMCNSQFCLILKLIL